MNQLAEIAEQIQALEKRIADLEAREHPPEWVFATEDLELVDSGSAGATQQDWVECTVGGNTGYVRIYATK